MLGTGRGAIARAAGFQRRQQDAPLGHEDALHEQHGAVAAVRAPRPAAEVAVLRLVQLRHLPQSGSDAARGAAAKAFASAASRSVAESSGPAGVTRADETTSTPPRPR